ncbi:hypothetical protein DRO30_02440 [Candidatus Bathyarchaeota archaeon]|nr:MAG: hypothetical protein DRO30_02440 [Candidatus Bathyarchaeota archaeon]
MPKVFTVFEKIKGKYRETTLKNFLNHMRILDKNCDIDNPREVWNFINNNYRDNGKKFMWHYYLMYARTVGLNINDLKFEQVKKIPFLPSEEMLDNIINTIHKNKIRNSVRLLKFGLRIGE